MSRAATSPSSQHRLIGWLDEVSEALRAAGPPLLFGLRLWVSVCLALYVAFWLELSNPFWAGTTAALVCQPQLGASLRKGWFRLVGTVIGAVAAVVLTACFPQSRAGFLGGLAVWAAICALFATVLRNFAAVTAALAGITTAIIAADELGAVGGANGQAFLLAVDRAAEICIGIVCAGLVLAGTDFGTARRRLAAQIAGLAAEITGRLAGTLRLAGPAQAETREVRRDLVRRAIALDPVIDEALGESSGLRYRWRVLQDALCGLFTALAAWRTAAYHLERLSPAAGHAEADIVLSRLPAELTAAPTDGNAAGWCAAPYRLRQICEAAVRALVLLPAATASRRLLADHIALALGGIAQALDGLALLADDPAHAAPRNRLARLRVPDWWPALVNAGRAFVTVGTVAVFWIATAWPGGSLAITFATVAVVLFSPRADQAYAAAASFMLGVLLTTLAAAVVKFAVLPDIETFPGFALAIGVYLVPIGAMMALPWQVGMFTAMSGIFIPVLAPQNPNIYDTQQFYNTALAIMAGLCAAMLAFRLLPPLSPAFRTRRLLALTLRDVRRLAARRAAPDRQVWDGGVFGRLSVLPEAATSEERARMVAALTVGNQVIRLKNFVGPAGFAAGLAAVLAAVAQGDSAAAVEGLRRLDRVLDGEPYPGLAEMQARAGILAMSEALIQYSAYFDGRAAR